MNPELLDQLRDIHLPPDPAWWPPAPGWIVLATLLVLMLGALVGVWLYRTVGKHLRLRRIGLNELGRIEREFQAHANPRRLVADVSLLMKRYLKTTDPEVELGGLSGRRWSDCLNQGRQYFDEDLSELLADGVYRPSTEFDTDHLLDRARAWIRGYRS